MNKQIMERINQECKKLYKRIGEECYNIPEEKCISIGDDTIISGIYIKYEDYTGIPFANGYLESSEVNFALALDVMSDEIGWQIVHILVNANITKRYEFSDLADILGQMRDYVQDAPDEEMKEYFKEITDTGFFHNSIGKVVTWDKDNTFVDVTEEY